MMKHNEMIDDMANKFIDAGYQVRKNLEYSFRNYKGEIDLLALDLEEVNINILKCEGIEYNNCDQRLFYLEECFCKKAINENPKVQEIYNKWLKLEF